MSEIEPGIIQGFQGSCSGLSVTGSASCGQVGLCCCEESVVCTLLGATWRGEDCVTSVHFPLLEVSKGVYQKVSIAGLAVSQDKCLVNTDI